jgi:cytoskeletal protein CcmA (bactofilin family)
VGKFKYVLATLVLLMVPAAALAARSDANMTTVLVKGDNRVGTYFGTGQSLTINGDVSGDLICAAQTVVINGTVGGDVICAAQTITINGSVAGSIRSVAQVLTINASVARNLTIAGQDITLGNNAKVGGELLTAGQTVALNAPIAGAIYAAADTLSLNAAVGSNATAYINSLNFGNEAMIAGNFDYTSGQTFSVDKAKIHGVIARHAPARSNQPDTTAADRLAMLIYWVGAALIGGTLAVWLAPRLVRSTTHVMLQRWQASMSWGLLGLVALPLGFLLLMFTVLGIPAALFMTGLWLLALTSSGVLAGIAIGRLAWQRDEVSQRSLWLSAAVGVPLVIIAGWLPIIGGLVIFAAAAWSLGGLMLTLNKARSLG